MFPNPSDVAAATGSLESDVLADLVALRNFVDGRDHALEALFSVKLRRSSLRDELIRAIVIDFGFERPRTIAHYRRTCLHLGKPFEIRQELQTLADHGLAVFAPAPGRRLGWMVLPTQRLVDWYSGQMPRLMTEVSRYMLARGSGAERAEPVPQDP